MATAQSPAELSERIDLPGLRRADDAGPPRAAMVECRLDAGLAASVSALAAELDCRESTVLAAGVAGLLALLRAGTEFPLGVSAAGVRLLRVAASAGTDFRSLVAEVRSRELAAAEIAPDRRHFQIGVAVDGAPAIPGPGEAGELWFSLHALRLRLTYLVSAIDPHNAQTLCDRLARVLTFALRDPDGPLDAIDCLLPGEAQGLICQGFSAPIREGSLAAWFEERVRASGDEIAVIDGARRLTYDQLNTRANRLARALVAAGAGPERAVAVALPRSELSVTAFVAVLKTGATYMPVDTELPPARMAFMLQDADPAVVIVDAESTRSVDGDVPRLELDESLSCCAAQSGGNLSARELNGPILAGTSAYLLYTSGSTGRPKGVLMPQAAVLNLLAWHLDELPGEPGRVTVQFTSLSFDISVQEMLSALLSGAALAIVPDDIRRSPHDFVPWLEENGVTDLFAPNVVIELICQAALEQGRALPELANIAQAGEALVLSDAVREFFRIRPGRRLHNHYGPTETHAVTSHVLPVGVTAWPATAPVGRAIRNSSVYVLDDALRLVPPGVAGELYASGACLARGYLDRPALSAERFLPDPYGPPGTRMYRTGDLVRRRPDGTIEYLGRTDHQIKIRGVRVELGEVEAAVRRVPGVRDTVLVTAGESGNRRIDAYLVPAPDTDAESLGALAREELRNSLPSAMIPASFTVVAEFPLNSNGKVDRHALPEPVFAGPDAADRPRTEQEQRLARIFADVLGLPAVGVHDNFYDIGGHSLLAASASVLIRKEFQVELTLGDVLANPSVAELATLLSKAEPARPPVTARGDGPAPASFTQQSLWVLDQLEGPGPQYNEPLALRLAGNVDVAALRRALADVLERHQVLRTVLDMEDGQIRQRVLDAAAAVPKFDEVAVEEAGLPSALVETARSPFDLARDLPVRSTLFHWGTDEHLLLVVMHHIACDGVSLRLFLRDLAAAYNARVDGRGPDWAPLPVQYADYAAWERDLFAADAAGDPSGFLRRQYRYWKQQLANLPDTIPLPLDRDRPAIRSGAGEAVPFHVSPEEHREIRAFAQSRNTSTFAVVHAALVDLLAARGAGGDIAVATVVSDRGDLALGELVGAFVRTLVLRVDASGEPAFPDLLDRVRETDLAAFAHQDLPFEHVVELANPARSLAYHPLTQVMLAFQVEEADPPEFTGLTARFQPVRLGVAKFDLCFKVFERFTPAGEPLGIEGILEYATDVFEAETARSLAAGLVRHLTAGVSLSCGR